MSTPKNRMCPCLKKILCEKVVVKKGERSRKLRKKEAWVGIGVHSEIVLRGWQAEWKECFWAIDCRGQRSVVIEYRPLIITVPWQCRQPFFSKPNCWHSPDPRFWQCELEKPYLLEAEFLQYEIRLSCYAFDRSFLINSICCHLNLS